MWYRFSEVLRTPWHGMACANLASARQTL